MLSLAQILGDVSTAHVQAPEDWARSVTHALREAAIHHQSRNGYYRARCDAFGVDPATITGLDDLQGLPLVPVGLFRRPDARMLLTCSLAEVEAETHSTGGGVPWIAHRNAETVTRALVGLTGTYREFFTLSSGTGLFLGPSTADAAGMGVVKVFTILNGVFDHHAYLADDDVFDPREALGFLQTWAGRTTRHLIGTPFLIGRFLRFLEHEGTTLRLDPYSMVIALDGGRRPPVDAASAEDLRDRCRARLGVRAENVRGMYGMVESNMLAVECHLHRQHVPPWCYVSIRDVDDIGRELPAGSTGLIGVMDALNTSYPGFLLSEDLGEVETGTCGCGRTGQVLTVRRGPQGAGPGGYGGSIQRYLDAGRS
jgi:long-chain-fatty-acid---luciferin-component ligase